MWARRIVALTAVALAPMPALADAGRVGFAVIPTGSPLESAEPAASIASLREKLLRRDIFSRPAGALRDALEGPLSAEQREDEILARARQRLASAREAYAAFEYDRALARLGALDRELVDREPARAVIDLMVERHLLTALVHEGARRRAQARRSFRLVHHLDPDRHALDPGAYRPQAVALFADVVRSADRPGALRVVVEPAGARVWLDGVPAGEAPLSLTHVPAGEHWVVATAPGHRSAGALVEVEPGGTPPARAEPTDLSLTLARQSPTVRAQQLRRKLASSAERGALAELTRIAVVDALVLVRVRGGKVQGAVYASGRGELSPWLPIRSDDLLDRIAAAPRVVLDPALLAAPPPSAERSPSWYGTWWGRSLLVAGGVAVTGAIVYAATASGSEDDPGYSIGVCFEGSDCP